MSSPKAGGGLRRGLQLMTNNVYRRKLSKAVDIGSTARLFLPTFVDESGVVDIYTGTTVGREITYDIFKSTFMTYKPDWYTVDEDGKPKEDLTGTDSYERIFKIIFEAQCESEKEQAKIEAKKLAESNGGVVDEVALLRKIDRIDEKYHGRKGDDESVSILPGKKPAIGKLTNTIVSEILVVPMDTVTNTPIWNKSEIVYKSCKKSFIAKLIPFLDNRQFCDPSKGYLELSYTYGTVGQKPAQAGQSATISGVSAGISLEELFPEEWEKVGRARLEKDLFNGERDIDKCDEIILRESGFKSGRVTPEDIKSITRKWVGENMIILTHINMSDPSTLKGANDLITSGLVNNISTVKQKLTELLETNGETVGNGESVNEAVQNMASTPTEEQSTSTVENAAPATEPTSEESKSYKPKDMTGGVGLAYANQNMYVPETDDDDELGDLMEV